MMTSDRINDYIEKRYDNWLDYAAYHCRVSGLRLEPKELLNDVLLQLLQRDRDALAALLGCRNGKYARFDYLVLRIIKINICSPRSHFRYVRGQHCTHTVDWNTALCREPATDPDGLNLDECYRQVREVFDALELTDKTRRIFEWRFFEGKSFSEWPGGENRKYLYDNFNRIFSKISRKIRGK